MDRHHQQQRQLQRRRVGEEPEPERRQLHAGQRHGRVVCDCHGRPLSDVGRSVHRAGDPGGSIFHQCRRRGQARRRHGQGDLRQRRLHCQTVHDRQHPGRRQGQLRNADQHQSADEFHGLAQHGCPQRLSQPGAQVHGAGADARRAIQRLECQPEQGRRHACQLVQHQRRHSDAVCGVDLGGSVAGVRRTRHSYAADDVRRHGPVHGSAHRSLDRGPWQHCLPGRHRLRR